MVYACGYRRNAANLEQARKDKLEPVCRKLSLKPGRRVLDIGCGWGNFAEYAAEKYGRDVVGITVSKEQVPLARKRWASLPVSFRLQDHREVREQFDAMVSMGMFEHVGHKNYRTFMKVLPRCMKPGSLALLHAMGKTHSTPGVDPLISRHIFGNSETPSPKRTSSALKGTDSRGPA